MTGTITLWIEALFAVGRGGHPPSNGVVAAGLPQVLEAGPENLEKKYNRRGTTLVRGQQYKYGGRVVHFLREVGLVYNQLPLLPQ